MATQQRKYTDPREGLNTFLKELFDAVKVGQLANEKMDWIRRGLFDALVARCAPSPSYPQSSCHHTKARVRARVVWCAVVCVVSAVG